MLVLISFMQYCTPQNVSVRARILLPLLYKFESRLHFIDHPIHIASVKKN